MGWRSVVMMAVVVCSTNCGGVVEENGPAPDGNGSSTPAQDQTTADTTSGAASSSSGYSSVTLANCRLGFLPSERPGSPCNYVVDGYCYDEKLDACACACTKKSGTDCISGFPIPGGKVSVSCD